MDEHRFGCGCVGRSRRFTERLTAKRLTAKPARDYPTAQAGLRLWEKPPPESEWPETWWRNRRGRGRRTRTNAHRLIARARRHANTLIAVHGRALRAQTDAAPRTRSLPLDLPLDHAALPGPKHARRYYSCFD